ncbi:hypothetical protein LSH36_584g01043 [Paralvinella palmiformis]|uniref:Uncharacterized protein n=1 Tax=Paralvinella palmiformis TaxID=53620 RepID=A0AAD9J5E6_9ANNE|nr:hypothetical protein LSH36_584g01043 [Paralvinella palmiformis]
MYLEYCLRLTTLVNAEVVRIRDAEQKAKQKRNADAKSVKPISQLHVGDTVVVRQPKVNKLSTNYHRASLTVAEVKGTMITATDTIHGNKTLNASHFKRVLGRKVQEPKIQDMEIDEQSPAAQTQHDIESTPNESPDAVDGPAPLTRTSRARRLPSKYKDFVLK